MKTSHCFAALMAALLVASGASGQTKADDIEHIKKELAALRAEVKSLTEAVARLTKAAGKPSNPFDVKDVPDPNGTDVEEFAATVKLFGDAKDPNAEQWTAVAVKGDKRSLDGEWYGRWNSRGSEWSPEFKAQVKTLGERVYIFYTDHQGRFLIDLRREKGRLVGRVVGIDNPLDTNPCVIVVVGAERLDGTWGGNGRLDFRRKLQ